MSQSSENHLFRLFVMGWMSLMGVIVFLFMALDFLGFSEDVTGDLMCILPILLFSLLVYSYVKSKDVLLKRLCYGYMMVGIPCILLMFIAPMLMSSQLSS